MADTAEIRQLEEQGYTFHGAYSWNKDEIKARAAKLRDEGHKARIAYCPGSKYARGYSGGGWSVYWIESEASIAARKERGRIGAIFSLQKEKTAIIARLIEINQKLEELQKEGE